ncbi:glycosyltransferase family 1 protein [Alloacidobacterium sp.]|uniref:glycosyltransferase family 4 protein n=1 Tax=Alloacidobacterium sp. TaxID=2951999 RepID=UPI002D53B80E|nr:glycosyltransferase family 1 protein [Alloacidobacterium sp.]HYK34990.1 glycosyltransferase family 1 protein [Alloacidobacterium sp.]
MLRYADMLQQELNSQGHEVRIIYPPVVFGRLSFFPGLLQKWIGYIDKYLLAPAYLQKQVRHTDVIHICDHSNAMYLKCAKNRPTVITCHDLLAVFAARGIFPGIRIGFTGRIQQRWIAASLSRAKHIVCVSAKTQDDLESLVPGIRPRTTVIHHHLNWNYSPADSYAVTKAKSEAGLSPEDEYLLHVGGNQWYKNRLGVMRIFFVLRKHPRFQQTKLIMAGKPWTVEMRRYCISSGLAGEIIERAEVSNDELEALYSGTTALLFPSVEEGFGWPVLEAQACGCPVITSSRPPMTEIAGDAALFIDPSDPLRAAELIAEHATDLPSLRAAGFRNLTRFAKNKTISRYSELYQRVIDSERQ